MCSNYHHEKVKFTEKKKKNNDQEILTSEQKQVVTGAILQAWSSNPPGIS